MANTTRIYATSVDPTQRVVPGGSPNVTFIYTFPLNSAPGDTTASISPMNVNISGDIINEVNLTFSTAGKTAVLMHRVGDSTVNVIRDNGLGYEFLDRDGNIFTFRFIVRGSVILPRSDSEVVTRDYYVFRLIHPNDNGGVTLIPNIKGALELGLSGDFTTKEYDAGGGCILL